ncbi:hypothetical protein JTE90_028616 [Oedothorax gibbosus]|uniref:Reverse transcriptase domain-containing protein n=1 Tax=Oedothorax gibbosus TaxID=931172 RepID=A0AAV6TZC7_9ARAC|nr:hypothetical protein JTE90_028616 [Oedothorax gibbosus]
MEVRNSERPLPSWFSWQFTSLHQNLLKTRVFQVRVGSTLSRDFYQREGVPQGSVLSVMLFILKINGIVEQLPPAVKGTLFVDDFQISCASTNMSTVERQLQIAIRKITGWTNNNGFVISNQKTICMHFCRKRELHPDPEIILNGVALPYGLRCSCAIKPEHPSRFVGLNYEAGLLMHSVVSSSVELGFSCSCVFVVCYMKLGAEWFVLCRLCRRRPLGLNCTASGELLQLGVLAGLYPIKALSKTGSDPGSSSASFFKTGTQTNIMLQKAPVMTAPPEVEVFPYSGIYIGHETERKGACKLQHNTSAGIIKTINKQRVGHEKTHIRTITTNLQYKNLIYQ